MTTTTPTAKPSPPPPEATGVVTEQEFRAAVPNIKFASRIPAVFGAQVGDFLRSAAMKVPALSSRVDRPRRTTLKTSSLQMYRWFYRDYGTAEKPASLEEVPWDYVIENQDSIPFLGLREYWYPAMRTADLHNNEHKAITMLGDNIVVFRDSAGKARALENRCPHRGPLLSLGQVGVLKPGTITCRYHGMTFDGQGECVGYIAEGPNSSVCGKVRARAYPAEERAGMIWLYMGKREAPDLESTVPHGKEVLQEKLLIRKIDLPYSHLNILDNATDLGHVGTLHRMCAIFGDHKPFGEIKLEEVEGGVRAYYAEQGQHAGDHALDQIYWYLPNVVYHPPGDVTPFTQGWLWMVPRDVGNFTLWFMMGIPRSGGLKTKLMTAAADNLFFTPLFRSVPGADCIYGGDGPMQASQGRVVRWDKDFLTQIDRPLVRVRRMLKAAHAAEIAERKERGTQANARRITAPRTAG